MVFRRKKRPISSYRRTKQSPKRRVQKRRVPGKTLRTSSEPKNKASLRRKKQITHRTRGLWGQTKRYIILILGGALILYITNALFISESLTIQTIQINENELPVNDHPIEGLLDSLKGSNILLLKTNDFEYYLEQQYPQYETLRISKNLPDTLTITLKTYPVVANLTVEVTDGDEQTFSLTAAGQTTNYEESNIIQADLRTIIIESDQSLGESTFIMTQEKIAFILEAMQDFEDRFGMAVLHARYFDIERETHLWTERNFYVWLDMTADLDEQLNKLKKGLPRLNIYEVDLEYIDLRIAGINGEKIIYKPK